MRQSDVEQSAGSCAGMFDTDMDTPKLFQQGGDSLSSCVPLRNVFVALCRWLRSDVEVSVK